MPHEGSLLQTAVIFLLAAVLAVPLAKRLHLGAVLGYLLAGVIIGPQALGLIRDTESVAHISELGVVLLLFIIGLELSPKRLWLMRKSVFGVGTAQVLLTGALIDRSEATLPPDVVERITRKRKAGEADAAVDPLTEPDVKAALDRANFELLVGFQLSEDQLAYNVTR